MAGLLDKEKIRPLLYLNFFVLPVLVSSKKFGNNLTHRSINPV